LLVQIPILLLLFIELSFIILNEKKINNTIMQINGGSMENRQEQQNRQDRQNQQHPKDQQDQQDQQDKQSQQDRQEQQEQQNISSDQSSLRVKVKLREFIIPPINDALIIGKNAPIGSEAMRRALSLLHGAPFDMIKVEDDIISEILVRNTILKKIQQDNFVNLILKKVKPFMSIDEVIHLDIYVEMFFEEVV
jgi:Sec-independent protein translocase protein TatA